MRNLVPILGNACSPKLRDGAIASPYNYIYLSHSQNHPPKVRTNVPSAVRKASLLPREYKISHLCHTIKIRIYFLDEQSPGRCSAFRVPLRLSLEFSASGAASRALRISRTDRGRLDMSASSNYLNSSVECRR